MFRVRPLVVGFLLCRANSSGAQNTRNHQMILNSANGFAKMETEILRKVQQNIGGWHSLKPESTMRPATKGNLELIFTANIN